MASKHRVFPSLHGGERQSPRVDKVSEPIPQRVVDYFKGSCWLLGVLVLAALTIRDCVPLLGEYQSNNVAIQVVVVPSNNSFKPPRIVLCIPYYELEHRNSEDLMSIVRYLLNSTENCTVCQALEDRGWGVWAQEDFSELRQMDSKTVYNTLSALFVNKIFSQTPEENVLSPKFASWNAPIFSAVSRFFYWRLTNDYSYEWQSDFETPDAHELKKYLKSADYFNDRTKLDQLFGNFLVAFCHKFLSFTQMSFANDIADGERENITCIDLVQDQSLPVAFDPAMGFWVSIPAPETPTAKEYSFNLLETSPPFWTAPKSSKLKPYMIYPDISVMYIDEADTFYSTCIYEGKTQKSSLKISVRYNVQMRTRDSRSSAHCQKESTEICFVKCTKYRIIDKCGCVPFFYARGLDYDRNLSYCTIDMYQACDVLSTVSLDKEVCSSRCSRSCEFTSYNWRITHDSTNEMDEMTNGTVFTLKMVPVATAFAEFAWTVKNTPEQFISQIGGIASFYLGFDGLSIVGLVILCVNNFLLCGSRLRRKNKGVDGKESQIGKYHCSGTAMRHPVQGTASGNEDKDESWLLHINELRSEMLALKNQNMELISAIRAIEKRL